MVDKTIKKMLIKPSCEFLLAASLHLGRLEIRALHRAQQSQGRVSRLGVGNGGANVEEECSTFCLVFTSAFPDPCGT